jgi:membrane-associated phospholipid phosphatase
LIAYSRVHTGVHYPADVVVGGLIGTVVGQLTARALDR